MPSKPKENHDKTQRKFQVDASFLKQIPNNQKNQKKGQDLVGLFSGVRFGQIDCVFEFFLFENW